MTQPAHLHAVPDRPDPEASPLLWVHLTNGAKNLQRDALHHMKAAREAGNEGAALAFAEVYEAARRAEEFVR